MYGAILTIIYGIYSNGGNLQNQEFLLYDGSNFLLYDFSLFLLYGP